MDDVRASNATRAVFEVVAVPDERARALRLPFACDVRCLAHLETKEDEEAVAAFLDLFKEREEES